MSAQMKDLVAELLNQGYAFDDIKNEIDAQIKAREDEAKRVQEETIQKQKIEAADQLVADVLAFLNTYYPDYLADVEVDSVEGIGELLVKELDSSLNMFKLMVKTYTPKKPKSKAKKSVADPIALFLQEFGL